MQLLNASKNKNSRIPHKTVHNILQASKKACPWISRNIINKRCKKILLVENIENISIAETNNTDGITNNLVDEDCEEVDGITETLLAVPNTQQEETEDNAGNIPKEGRPKNDTIKKSRYLNLTTTYFINGVAAKHA